MEPLGKDRAKRLAKLLSRKGRNEQEALLLDSVPLIAEGLQCGLVRELIFLETASHPLLEEAESKGILCTPSSEEIFPKLCDVKTSPGMVAVAQRPNFPELSRAAIQVAKKNFVLFLDHIADPGNLGTIVRSAGAFGCDLILVSPDCADVFSPKAMRASAGALLKVELAEGVPTPDFEWPIFYRATARGGIGIPEISPSERRGLWLGNESHGPRPGSTDLGVIDVTIAMQASTESLNVTAAAAILCHKLGLIDGN